MEIVKTESDFFTNIERAFSDIDNKYNQYPGYVICGSHDPEDVDRKMALIKYAREKDIPCFGVCMGMQLMVIEYARNVLGLKDANSIEIDPLTPNPVIVKLPELRVGIHQVESNWESHWNHYSFNEKYRPLFEKDWSMHFENGILEIMRYRHHPFFIGVQYHPEYREKHPLLSDFLKVCKSEINAKR